MRVYVMLRGPGEFLARRRALQPEIGLGDGRLTVRAIKVVADGALGSRGALLLEPYADEPGTRGLHTVDAGRRSSVSARPWPRLPGRDPRHRRRRQPLRARRLRAAFAGLRRRRRHRFRVEHAQVLAPADVPRFKTLGVLPSMQPTHCTSDMYWADDRLGPERAKGAYLWKTFLTRACPCPRAATRRSSPSP